MTPDDLECPQVTFDPSIPLNMCPSVQILYLVFVAEIFFTLLKLTFVRLKGHSVQFRCTD